MEKKIVWTQEALYLLHGFYEYITSYNEAKAELFLEEIFEFVKRFQTFPEMYPICRNPDLATRNYRCAVFKKKYIIVYRITKTVIDILAVIHASRNPNDFLKLIEGNEDE